MQSSQLRRLLYYKAFGYRYVGAEILSGGARFFKALDALKSATAECNREAPSKILKISKLSKILKLLRA